MSTCTQEHAAVRLLTTEPRRHGKQAAPESEAAADRAPVSTLERLDRLTQVRLVLSTSLESAKAGVAVGAVLSVVLLVFPWLTVPLSLMGVVGTAKASLDLFHAFWDGLDDEQKLQVTVAAHEAGVSLSGFFRNDGEGLGSSAVG